MPLSNQLILINSTTINSSSATSSTPVPATAKTWACVLSTGAKSGTGPTLDVTVQHSADGTNWVTLIAFTQVTADNAYEVKFAAAATDYLKPLLPYVRTSYTLGGTTPSFAAVTVKFLYGA